MKNESSSPINTRPTGVIVSGGDDHDEGRLFAQPEPAKEGAAPARVRKSESNVSEGHHVSAGGAVAEPYARDSKLAAGKHTGLAQHAADSDAHESPAPTPESKQRAQYVASERKRKEEKTASSSGRKSVKELVSKSRLRGFLPWHKHPRVRVGLFLIGRSRFLPATSSATEWWSGVRSMTSVGF
jgi:hypothetical protein